MSQIPSDANLAPIEGPRDEHAAALSAPSAASSATTTAPIHTPNRRRQSQRARAKATAPAKNANEPKDSKELTNAPHDASAITPPTPAAQSAHDAEQHVGQSAPAEAAGASTPRRGRNAPRRANTTEQPGQGEKSGRVAKGNKTTPLGKPETALAPSGATAAQFAADAQSTNVHVGAQPVNGAQVDQAGDTNAPLIVPVTTQEAHARTGRTGRGAHRGRGRDHQADTSLTTADAGDAMNGGATSLTISLEQSPTADTLAPTTAEHLETWATVAPAPTQTPLTTAPTEAAPSRYRFDRRARVASQPGAFAQPREERLSGLYTTPTIAPATAASAPTMPITAVAQAAPTAPEASAPITPDADVEAPLDTTAAPDAVASETVAVAPQSATQSAPATEGRPRRFGAPRRIRVEPFGAAPATATPVERAAPEAAPQPATEEASANAPTHDQSNTTAAFDEPEAPAEILGEENGVGDEEDTAETATQSRGTSSRRSRNRRRRKSSTRANADGETDERADADLAPTEGYEDATDAYAAAPDEELANGYTPSYGQPGYAPTYERGYDRDYNAEYGEFSGPESYGEPYAPAPFTPAPYAPPAAYTPPTPPSFAPAPYTPGGRLPTGQNAGQWQGNTPRGAAPTSGRNTNAPAPTNPYGSPEPAFARGFGPQPSGVASSTRDQYTAPYTRNGRNGERNGDRNGEGALLTNQVNAAIRDVRETFQQQTDRLLTEMRRTVTPPTMTVAFPAAPSTERVGVFVDVANVLYSARNQRITVDFGRLLEFLRGNRRLIRAHAYAPTSPEPGADQSFLTAVKGLGYRITTKNYKTFASGAKKADLDLDMCMDIVRLVEAKALDTIALVSGDSDFLPVLEYCSDHGVRCEVAAFEDSAAMILRQSCDVFVNLSMLDEIRN